MRYPRCRRPSHLETNFLGHYAGGGKKGMGKNLFLVCISDGWLERIFESSENTRYSRYYYFIFLVLL
jgi:hypothetical protein